MVRLKKSFKNFIKCKCSRCPSHNICAKFKFEKVFCASGAKNTCISDKKGCICKECPVYKENGLEKIYYCIKGE